MKTIPWTMVAFEQDFTRAYLDLLYDAGYIFERIIVCLHPRLFGQYNAAIKKRQKHLEEIADVIAAHTSMKFSWFSRLDFSKYCSNIEIVDEFKFYPDGLLRALNPGEKCLFSYVGIIPKDFLQKADWLHIHGGLMPSIRGSTCIYWGLLYRGKPGYSLFRPTERIDQGEILYQDESDEHLPNFSTLPNGIDVETFYIGVGYYDIYLRAKLLVDYLEGGCKKKNYSQEQIGEFNHPDRMFFRAHNEIIKFCITKFFNYRGWSE